MQIRYGGCKGVLSVCPELNECSQQLVLRHSMRKFSSDHDILESCRISAPRKRYLCLNKKYLFLFLFSSSLS